MKWTEIFIRRPVLAICVNLLVLLIGYQSIRSLNVRQYPRTDVAAVVVTTAYVGANADLVRGFVTTPLERSISTADGIDYLESSSYQSFSTITARLRLNFPVNDALTQIQAKVAQVRNELPPEAEAPTIEVQNADSQFAAMYIGFYSDTLEGNQITDYIVRVIQPKLVAIKGVQKADILGGRTFAMRIWLKPDRMAALNISPSQVSSALARNNALSAVGNTKGTMLQVNLVANTDLKTEKEFQEMVVKQDGNTLVKLKDIAKVELGAETYDTDVRFSGKKAIFLGIYVLPNANSIDVIGDVRKEFPIIQKQLPTDIQGAICYDSTGYINDAIHEVIRTLTETVIIVIIVIFIFLGSLRSVIVPVVAIPLSLVGACAIMLMLGFTINLLTLLAIVLAVGLVVDDAIVMLENVERYVNEGLNPIDAAIKSANELTAPIISMTITLAAVYAPIAFQGGLTGALFREFALTLAGAVVISGFVALTLSPMMSSRLLEANHHPNRFQLWITRNFERLRAAYRRRLIATLDVAPATVMLGMLIGLLAIPLWMFTPSELAPNEDQGVLFGIVLNNPGASIEQASLFGNELEKAFRALPETDITFQILNPTRSFAGAVTKPWSDRSRTTMDMSMAAFPTFSGVAGVKLIPIVPPPLPGGSDFPVEFVVTSTANPQQLLDISKQLIAAAMKSGVFMFADSDLKYDLPQSEILLDRDKVAAMGLNLSDVAADLGSLIGGNYVNRFSIEGRSYKVIPQVKRNERLNPEQLANMYVRGPKDEMVQLSTFATIKNTVEPRQLNRFQQLNSVKIQGAIPPGVSKDAALKVLEDEAKKILPLGFNVDYSGESRQLRTEGNSLLGTGLLACILIYLVLAAQFESFRDPFIILGGSVPMALASALVFVFLGWKHATINIYTQVGLITLVGLISKNGILIVEFANQIMEERGLSKRDAIVEACTTRFRPVLMTTVATVFGHMPLVFVTGAGAVARNNIGVVLVTGMSIGTVFTLFVLPSIYLYVAADKRHAKATPTSAESAKPARPPMSPELAQAR